MTVAEIVSKVRSAIDELSLTGNVVADITGDGDNLTRIIVDKIAYALVFVLENAPLDKMDSDTFKSLSSAQIGSLFSIDATTLVATLKLPTDVLRIVEARLSSWSHFPIPVPDTSEVYLMQQDQYAKGSYDRPVNIFTYNGTTDRLLEMYCARTASDTLIFRYIAKPDVSNIDTEHMSTVVNLPSKLEAALVYQVAGLTLLAFREEAAASMFSMARQYLGMNEDNNV